MDYSKIKIDGKYTVISINDGLAVGISRVVRINGEENGRKKCQEIGKGPKRTYFLSVDDCLIFEGNDVPFCTDFDSVDRGIPDTFTGSATFNLEGNINIEDVRRFIGQNNLNENAGLEKVYFKGVPVFPELCPDYVFERRVEAEMNS